MKKIVTLCIALTTFLILSISTTLAKETIVAEPDFDESVIFYAWDTSTSRDVGGALFGGKVRDNVYRTIAILKYFDGQGNMRYWIRVDSPDEKKYLQNGAIYIDDEVLPLKQIDQWNRLLLTSGRKMIKHAYYPVNFAFYELPEKYISKIVDTPESSKIVISLERTERPMAVLVDKEFRAEIVTLSKLTRADYDTYKVIDKETPEQKKDELMKEKPKQSYEQMKNPNRY